MMTNNRGFKRRNSKCSGGARIPLALLSMLFLPLVACDNLLEVEIPGSVFEGDLHDPRLATTLAHGAQADFECAFKTHQETTGLWTDEFEVSGAARDLGVIGARLPFITIYGQVTGCGSMTALWTPLHVARFQGERSAEILAEFEDADVPNKQFLIGKSLVHAGWAYVLLAEDYCELTINVGPKVARSVGFTTAIARFGTALTALASASGSDAAEAANLMNFARVGRARANLNLGNGSAVGADASAVPADYIRTAYGDASDERLYSAGFVDRNTVLVGGTYTVHPRFRSLTIPYAGGAGSVVDTRVPTTHIGMGLGHDGIADYWAQTKYTSRSDDIRIADYWEAQLMIAEVAAGSAAAVTIVNALRAHHSLPAYDATGKTAAEIVEVVREERRRTLFLEGVRMGDKLRWGEAWDTGVSDHGTAYGTDTCIPLQEAETLNNPNLF